MEKFLINEESPDDKKKQNRSIKDYFRDKLHISLHDGATVHHLVSYKTLKGVPNKVRIKDVLVLDGGNFDINDCIHRLLHYMAKRGKTFTFKDMIDELESVTIYVSEKDGEAFPISLKDYIAGDNRRIAPLEPQKVEDVPAPTGESENKEKTESMNEDTIKQGNAWVNKGKEGTHGKFRTKKEADAQRRAIWVNWNK